ncbi:hypothetical protein AUV02_04365 [Micrococcus sp. CH3]|nr:hypothetical protein AUV02_04365 [Micrococcus sp. CH3]
MAAVTVEALRPIIFARRLCPGREIIFDQSAQAASAPTRDSISRRRVRERPCQAGSARRAGTASPRCSRRREPAGTAAKITSMSPSRAREGRRQF